MKPSITNTAHSESAGKRHCGNHSDKSAMPLIMVTGLLTNILTMISSLPICVPQTKVLWDLKKKQTRKTNFHSQVYLKICLEDSVYSKDGGTGTGFALPPETTKTKQTKYITKQTNIIFKWVVGNARQWSRKGKEMSEPKGFPSSAPLESSQDAGKERDLRWTPGGPLSWGGRADDT